MSTTGAKEFGGVPPTIDELRVELARQRAEAHATRERARELAEGQRQVQSLYLLTDRLQRAKPCTLRRSARYGLRQRGRANRCRRLGGDCRISGGRKPRREDLPDHANSTATKRRRVALQRGVHLPARVRVLDRLRVQLFALRDHAAASRGSAKLH